jgi:hypothetical protein
MIRLNITKNGKVFVKSFVQKIDLQNYVLDFIGADQYSNFTNTAEKIWNLNVGTSLSVNGYTIAMAGKSRAGMVILIPLKVERCLVLWVVKNFLYYLKLINLYDKQKVKQLWVIM